MSERAQPVPGLEPVLTTSELAAHLGVPVQTIHDLRHSGRGPRGIRVGRELRFRLSEIQAWLLDLEERDHATSSRAGEVR
ncbi:MAG: helix-turn-helix transcriptional regulator [Georgenia sp.]